MLLSPPRPTPAIIDKQGGIAIVKCSFQNIVACRKSDRVPIESVLKQSRGACSVAHGTGPAVTTSSPGSRVAAITQH